MRRLPRSTVEETIAGMKLELNRTMEDYMKIGGISREREVYLLSKIRCFSEEILRWELL